MRGLNERTEVGAAAVGQRNRQAAGEEGRRSCGAPLDSALDDPPAATATRTRPISRVGEEILQSQKLPSIVSASGLSGGRLGVATAITKSRHEARWEAGR